MNQHSDKSQPETSAFAKAVKDVFAMAVPEATVDVSIDNGFVQVDFFFMDPEE